MKNNFKRNFYKIRIEIMHIDYLTGYLMELYVVYLLLLYLDFYNIHAVQDMTKKEE